MTINDNFISGTVLYLILLILISNITDIFLNQKISSPQRKRVCTLNYLNKDLEDIIVFKIFQMKDAIDSLQFNLQDHESILASTYKLTVTIRNKLFSYKQIVELIELDEGQLLNDELLNQI